MKYLCILEDVTHFEIVNRSHIKDPLDEETTDHLTNFFQKNPNLEYVDISSCRLGEYTLEEIINSLSNHPNIKALSMANYKNENDGMEELSELLKNSKTLTYLDISTNSLDEYDMEILSKGIIANSSLTFLNIGQNVSLDVNGLKYLSKSLIQNVTIQSLALYNQHIGHHGATIIAEVLKQNGSLTQLELTNTSLGSLGIYMLSDGLKKNFTLKILQIGGNDVFSMKTKEELTNAIAYLMKDARYLEELDISDSDLEINDSLLDSIENTRISSIDMNGNFYLASSEEQLMVLNSLKKNQNLRSLTLSMTKITEEELYDSLLKMSGLTSVSLHSFYPKNGKLLADFIIKKENLKILFIFHMTEVRDIDPIVEAVEKHRSIIRFEGMFYSELLSKNIEFYLKRNKLELTGIKEKLKYFEMTRHSFHDIKFHFQNNLKRKLENLE